MKEPPIRTNVPVCKRGSGSQIAEFGPALFIFFVLVFFPLVNLFAYTVGVATATLIAHQCSTAAAVSQTYADALTATSATAQNLSGSVLGQFARLTPKGGYAGCGVDLYILVTNLGSNTTKSYGPNQPLNIPIDTTNNIYEYQVQANYIINPLFNMSGIPLVSNVAMLGQAVRFVTVTQKAAEYPESLTTLINNMSSPHSASGAP